MKCPTPLSRQCGTGKRRGKRRKKSVAANAAEKRTGIDGTKRKRVDQPIKERVPEWLIRQAAKARAA